MIEIKLFFPLDDVNHGWKFLESKHQHINSSKHPVLHPKKRKKKEDTFAGEFTNTHAQRYLHAFTYDGMIICAQRNSFPHLHNKTTYFQQCVRMFHKPIQATMPKTHTKRCSEFLRLLCLPKKRGIYRSIKRFN